MLIEQLGLLVEESLPEGCWMLDAFESLSDELLQVRVDNARIALDN